MARIRSIKPEFWTDEKIVSLSPLARLLFIGIWNFVDDDGRGDYSPIGLKLKILPADNADISELLGELRGKSLIQVYNIDGKEYFQVCGFAKHQKIDKRSASKLPPPPKSAELPRTPTTDQGRDQGMEGKDSEANASDAGASPSASPIDLKTELWRVGKGYLGKHGVNAKQAGSVLGGWRKQYGDHAVLDALASAQASAVSDPVPWITKALERRARSPRVNGTGPPKKPLGPAAGTPEFEEAQRRAGI